MADAVTTTNFEQEVLQSDTPVLVDFCVALGSIETQLGLTAAETNGSSS
jgi:thioredoxin-like negative regulator of GroEL